jgi:hypothetical protein
MIVRYVFAIFISVSCLLGISCTQPVQNDTIDQKEFASVWQYLKTFSIYQDSIPPDPFQSSTPQSMFDSLYDTLRGNPYTCYTSTGSSGHAAVSSKVTAKLAYPNVSVDSLTDSCCLVTISSFENDTLSVYDQFLLCQPKMQRFSKIIFDVRQNGGGFLGTMDSIIEDVLPAGIQYLRTLERVYNASTRTAATVDSIWRTTRPASSAFVNKKFAVLINDGSASASEIFAIALKDGLGAPLFGATSYGKAIGQIRLSRRGRLGIQITFAHFYRINKSDKNHPYLDYHRTGIAPDVVSNQPLLSAVKNLQPSVVDSSINYLLSKRAGSLTTSEVGLYKKVDESELQ